MSTITTPPPTSTTDPPSQILIRPVWSHNLQSEFTLIRNTIDTHPFISMDTEFPGVIFRTPHSPHSQTLPTDLYSTLKSNVDALKLIQVGITLTDANGNLPNLGDQKHRYIWEFNFRDFDISTDEHAPKSVDLLKTQGIDFEVYREKGVLVSEFAEELMLSGLVCNENVSWVTFHSGYDFGYLVKAITGKVLPGSLREFLGVLRVLFGKRVYDVKHLMKFCKGLHGGLDGVAQALKVVREVGKSHQAGSDSLLTWHAFARIREVYFKEGGVPEKYAGVLYGLEMLET